MEDGIFLRKMRKSKPPAQLHTYTYIHESCCCCCTQQTSLIQINHAHFQSCCSSSNEPASPCPHTVSSRPASALSRMRNTQILLTSFTHTVLLSSTRILSLALDNIKGNLSFHSLSLRNLFNSTYLPSPIPTYSLSLPITRLYIKTRKCLPQSAPSPRVSLVFPWPASPSLRLPTAPIHLPILQVPGPNLPSRLLTNSSTPQRTWQAK